MKANRKFNKQKKFTFKQSTVTYINNHDGTWNFTDEINGLSGKIDEAYVNGSLNKRLIIELADGHKLELIRYEESERLENPITHERILCPPDVVSLFEYITGGIIISQRYNHEISSDTPLALDYFKLNYPKEFAVVFNKVIKSENPYTFHHIPIPTDVINN